MSHLMTPQQSKDTEESRQRGSLMRLTVAQLKQRCAALGTPVTGTKPKLVSMILDPASHQRKKAAAGCGIKKKKKQAPKSLPASYMSALFPGYMPSYGMYGYGGMYDDEMTRPEHTKRPPLIIGSLARTQCSEDEDEGGYCEACDQLFPEEELYQGLCMHCQDAEDEYAIAHGVCPGCMKRMPPCEMDEEGYYVCCL